MVQKTMELIEKINGEINIRYDMSIANAVDIHDNSDNAFTMICNAFKFGYAQGKKATISELRKAAK